MFRRFVIVFSTLFFSFAVLFVSILRTASVRYSFTGVSANYSGESVDKDKSDLEKISIDYYLAYPGDVLPNHILWPLKAGRDKIWLFLTSNKSKKAELNLLFADKRLGAARILFENKEYEIGFTTLTKAEKYLENACSIESNLRVKGEDTNELLQRLVKASLKHVQVIKSISLMAPDDAKPKIAEVENYPKRFFEEKNSALKARGLLFLENPFNSQ